MAGSNWGGYPIVNNLMVDKIRHICELNWGHHVRNYIVLTYLNLKIEYLNLWLPLADGGILRGILRKQIYFLQTW